ncbi:MAG: ATP-binding protein [Rhodoferax sp.]
MRFRTKTIVGVALIEFALLGLLVGSTLSALRHSNEAELTRRMQLGAKLLAVAAKDAVITQDLATLDSLVTEAMASGQIDYVRILDAGGTVLAKGGDPKLLARPFRQEDSVEQALDGVFDRAEAVRAGGILHGQVQIGVSTNALQAVLASAQRWAAGIAALEILLVALFSWLLGTYLVRQLGALRKASERLAAGDFSHEMVVQGNDELAQTAIAFNRMARQLDEGQALLREESRRSLQARQAAEKSENLLREAIGSIAQGFTIYDEQDRLVQCNEAYLNFYEASRDLIVPGATFEEIVRRGAQRGQYHEALGNVEAWVAKRVAQHRQANGEMIEQQLADGRWLLIVEYRTPSGYIAGNRIDITERHLMEVREREYIDQLQAIFDLSPDGFVSFDGAGRVKYVSPAFARMTGLRHDTVIGLDEAEFSDCLARVCRPQARFPGMAALRMDQETALAAEPVGDNERRIRIETADASRRVLEVSLRERNANSVTRILYLRDITHEMEVDRLKSEFLSTAAHEMRTPMTSIYGFAELMLGQQFDETQWREYLGIIFRQTERMVSIINELLDLARIEARRGKDFQIVSLDLVDLLREIVNGFKAPGGRAAPQVPAVLQPVWVQADHKKLTQVVLNVLSNAYKYSPGGDAVELEVVLPAADIRPVPDSSVPVVGIRITDHGIGMTASQLTHVFERFYRADSSGKIPGTGLGMSIVREIVTLHGGQVSIDSTPGAGTTVTIWLPATGLPVA